MENDNRLEIYKKLIEAYDYFNTIQYDRGICILQNITEIIEEITNQIIGYNDPYRERFMNYTRRTMDYSRPIPKSAHSKQKRFVEWFHKAIFNISKNSYINSYSYIRDMKTILEELNDNNRAS